MKKLTQKQRLLNLLSEREGAGVFVYEIMMPRPQGLGIAQYNARIKELRSDGYSIINTTPGHFVLKPAQKPIDNQEMAVWIEQRMKEADRKERERVGNEPQMNLF